MKRSLAKLIGDLKSRSIELPVTRAEVDTLIEALEAQEKQAKLDNLVSRIRALKG
jgi:hypothetical protein